MTELTEKYFYDKLITFYRHNQQLDSEGGRKKGTKETLDTIKCNVHPTSNRQLKENFGIDIDAKLMITCSNKERIDKGFKFEYRDIEYEVIEILYYDSHKSALCQ